MKSKQAVPEMFFKKQQQWHMPFTVVTRAALAQCEGLGKTRVMEESKTFSSLYSSSTITRGGGGGALVREVGGKTHRAQIPPAAPLPTPSPGTTFCTTALSWEAWISLGDLEPVLPSQALAGKSG